MLHAVIVGLIGCNWAWAWDLRATIDQSAAHELLQLVLLLVAVVVVAVVVP